MGEKKDPKAERRRTRKEVRHWLIKETFDAYMTHPLVPKFKRTTTEAVRQIIEGWKARFGVTLSERQIYRILDLRPPDSTPPHFVSVAIFSASKRVLMKVLRSICKSKRSTSKCLTGTWTGRSMERQP